MIVEVGDDVPLAWRDLIEALALLSRGHTNNVSPTYCEHDHMYVCADPDKFTPQEVVILDELGFRVEDDRFMSFRFGSEDQSGRTDGNLAKLA